MIQIGKPSDQTVPSKHFGIQICKEDTANSFKHVTLLKAFPLCSLKKDIGRQEFVLICSIA